MTKDNGKKSTASKIVDAISVATAVPVFGEIGSKFFAFGKELWKDEEISKAIKAEIGKAIGSSTDQAAKDPEDELLYGFALDTLDIAQKKEAKLFEITLRKDFPKKAEAYVLWVAKIVKKFEKQTKKTTTPPKGSSEPKEEVTIIDITDGCIRGALFIVDVMDNIGHTDKDTFEARVNYLQGSNVFSLISEKKTSIIGSAVTAIKKDGTDAGAKATESIDKLTAWIKSKHR